MYKVLLADDEILVRDAIRENIEWNSLGYEFVKDCENGKEVMEYVTDHPVDVVITDILMPYVDGMELSKYLYENHPDISIIIFSGFGEFEYAKKAIQYQVSEYILKPVTARELTQVLRNLKEQLDYDRFQEKKIENLTKAYSSYKKNVSTIKSKALNSLVLGIESVQTSLTELDGLDVALDASAYRIVFIDIDHWAGLLTPDKETRKESALMTFVVENITNEILGRLGIAYRDSNNRVFVLISTNKPRETLKSMKEICRRIQNTLEDIMKLSVSITLGPYVKGLEDLHISYTGAVEAMGYRYTQGNGMVVDVELCKDKLDGEVNQEAEVAALCKNLKSGNESCIYEAVQRIGRIYRDRCLQKKRVLIYLQQVIEAIYDTETEMAGDSEERDEYRKASLNAIVESTCLQDSMRILRDYAVAVRERLVMATETSGQRQAVLAMSYIRNNYQNPDLNLNSICNYLNISASYFSSIFKEAIGETFMEVLIGIRMQKARELLEQTTLKTYEIAQRVGFSDPHYFSISFKKATGKTPTEYAREKRR